MKVTVTFEAKTIFEEELGIKIKDVVAWEQFWKNTLYWDLRDWEVEPEDIQVKVKP